MIYMKILEKQKIHLLNKDYFKQTRYYRNFEEHIFQTLHRKPNKLECEIVFDTLNVLLKLKKEYGSYWVSKQEHFNRKKKILEDYLSKYDEKLNKFKDDFCITLLKKYEVWLDEMKDIENATYNTKWEKDKAFYCNGIGAEIDNYVAQLKNQKFDDRYNGYCYYEYVFRKNKGYMSVLEYQEGLNDFIQEYNIQYRFDKLTDDEEIEYIKKLYSYMGKVSVYLSTKDYINAHNTIDEIIMCDKPNNLKAPFEYMLKVFKGIDALILNEEYENAYTEFKYFYEPNKKWFVRIS